VATIRLVQILMAVLTDLPFESIFGTAFWLGWSLNLMVAEAWINRTRRPSPIAAATG
jgi:hypothetical protein